MQTLSESARNKKSAKVVRKFQIRKCLKDALEHILV